jgi:hypothetical protein
MQRQFSAEALTECPVSMEVKLEGRRQGVVCGQLIGLLFTLVL